MGDSTTTAVGQRPMLYGLHARPPWPKALLAAAGHLLAMAASIIAAPLIIAGGLGVSATETAYLVAAALTVSGVATAVQVLRPLGLGSGLLSVQGTSFAFIGAFFYADAVLGPGSPAEESNRLGVLLGSAAVGALGTMVLAPLLPRLARVITPAVTGTTITLLGLSLVSTAVGSLQQAAAADGAGVWLQAAVVLGVIVLLGTRASPWLRLASISLGLTAGLLLALATGTLAALPGDTAALALPEFWRYELAVDWRVLAILAPIYLVTVAESIGDLTATASLSGQPVQGPAYWRRIRGGVMADGFNSVLAALFGTFPNTTFSQNNGVIALTGVASRAVGLLVALLLILLGLFPVLGALLQRLPPGVIHGATGFMFALIAVAGAQLLWRQADRRRCVIIAGGSLLAAVALTLLPDAATAAGIELPPMLGLLLGYPVASGALCAMALELVLPAMPAPAPSLEHTS